MKLSSRKHEVPASKERADYLQARTAYEASRAAYLKSGEFARALEDGVKAAVASADKAAAVPKELAEAHA